MKRTHAFCTDVIIPKNHIHYISAYSSVYFNGEPSNHWKITHSLCTPWVRSGFGGKMFNFEAFTLWICTKEDGAQRDEKDNCYVQTCSYCQKSKFQIIHCSKQMWDLLTAAWISKGNHHQTIGKLEILCVLLGLGLDLEELCSNFKAFTCWFFAKEDGAPHH